MSKLSVVVPIYNVEPYLRQCVDSIVDQTFRDLEIILVDDGSTDNCGAICDEYAARDKRVKVIHKENGGVATALNAGLEQAGGEWVCLIDSDDWIEPDRYERIFELMGSTDADIVSENGDTAEMPDGSRKKPRYFDEPFEATERSEMEYLAARLVSLLDLDPKIYTWMGAYWNKLFRREFLEEHHLRFSTSLVRKIGMHDSLFCLRAICKAKKIKGIAYGGYHYRIRMGSITKNYNYMADYPEVLLAYCHEFDAIVIEGGYEALWWNRLLAEGSYPQRWSLFCAPSFILTIGTTGKPLRPGCAHSSRILL